jgi:hypothetical protein
MNMTTAITNPDDRKAMETMLGALHPRFRLLWLLGTFTGFRIGDLLAIRANDVQELLKIKEQKTNKTREIALPPEIHTQFSRFIAIHAIKPDEFVFYSSASNKSKPISRQWANKVIARTARLRGLQGIGAHSMRKTFACDLFQSSGSIFAVQLALNHSKAETTKLYLRDIPQMDGEGERDPTASPSRAGGTSPEVQNLKPGPLFEDAPALRVPSRGAVGRQKSRPLKALNWGRTPKPPEISRASKSPPLLASVRAFILRIFASRKE